MYGEKKSECLSPFGDRSDNQNMYVHSVWVGEWAQGVHEVESTEVCEISLSKNLRGKLAMIRLGKVQENLEKILRGYLH